MTDYLQECVAKLVPSLSLPQRQLLSRYAEELLLWNPTHDFIRASSPRDIADHILDSLSGYSIVQEILPSKAADLGSGVGLPGIPLAIGCPETHFSLIERSAKRGEFLHAIVALLRLKNVHVIVRPAEEVKERFPLLVFRAFRTFSSDLCRSLLRLLACGGTVVAYKGRARTIAEELSVVSPFFRHCKVIPVTSSARKERHLVVLQQGED